MKSFPDGPVDKESTCNTRDTRDVGSIPGSGRSPGRGNGNPLQYSCLGHPTDRGAKGPLGPFAVQRVAKSWTQLTTKHSSVKNFRLKAADIIYQAMLQRGM